MDTRTDVAVLGAERYIGQLLLTLLDEHPQFTVSQLFASDDGQEGRYADSVQWLRSERLPETIAGLALERLGAPMQAPLCISVLPDGASAEWDRYYASSGIRVITHAEDLRLAGDVPLLVPELAAERIEAGEITARLLATPNCTTTILALPLAVLDRAFGVEALCVTTLQAISGSDLSGLCALDIADNLLPGLAGEEAALQAELTRLFARRFAVSAHAVRAPVHIGHCLTLSMRLAHTAPPEDITAALCAYSAPELVRRAPSGLAQPIRVVEGVHRPAPRPDAQSDGGMVVSVGAIRRCPVLGTAMTVVGNNMMRGSAGATLLLAEILHAADADETHRSPALRD